jgi:C4-type Zn-finger protein
MPLSTIGRHRRKNITGWIKSAAEKRNLTFLVMDEYSFSFIHSSDVHRF